MTTRDEFAEAIKKKPFPLRDCSICGYMMNFYYDGDVLHYDSRCECTSGDKYMGDEDHTVRPDSDLDFYLEPAHGHLERVQKFIAEVTGV